MSFQFANGWIDNPSDPAVKFPYEQIVGWVAVADTGEDLLAKTDFAEFPVARMDRPDLDNSKAFGFNFFLDLPQITSHRKFSGRDLDMKLFMGNQLVSVIRLYVSDELINACKLEAINKIERQSYIANISSRALRTYAGFRAPSALPSEWTTSPRLVDKKDIASSHHYGPTVQRFLAELPETAIILDAGAGLRRLPYRNVVNIDIYDYPSTDVLAIGQDLPFKDNSFDAILSLAVLEHVDDPFLCATELIRVLKPGGKILVLVPFLQAEHGYPSHYFNMTRFGVARLFNKAELISQCIEMSNHPLFTLNDVLRIYAQGLPAAISAKFLQMTVEELLAVDPFKAINEGADLAGQLSDSTKWRIASGTTSIFKKH